MDHSTLDKKSVFFNTVSQVLVRIAALVFKLVTVKIMTNYLGPVGVGEYNTITTYVSFFIVLADLGLFSVTVREISKKPENEKAIISNVLTLRIVTALIAAIIATVLIFFTDYSSNIKSGILIASGYIFLNLLSSIYDVILQYRLKMQFSALAEFISKLVSLAALVIIVQLHGNFLWIMSTFTLSGLVIYIFKWLFGSRYLKIKPEYDAKLAKWIFKAAIPLGMVFIINNLFFKLDTLILFIVKGATDVGIYSVSYKVLEVTVFIGSYFASALKPTLSANIQNNREYVGNVLNKSISLVAIIALGITIVCAAFPREIILFLSNQDFLSGDKALVILSLTLPLIYIDILLGEILIANDERKLLIFTSIFILIFNLVANLVIIPIYSFNGAALTTLISELVLMIINFNLVKRVCPYKVDYSSLFKILLVAAVTFVVALFLRSTHINFIILSVLIMIFYAGVVLMSGLIKIDKLKEIIR